MSFSDCVQALYPIVVILLVSPGQTDDDPTDVPSRSIHFASAPHRQPHGSPSIMQTMADGRLQEGTTDEEWRAWMFGEKDPNKDNDVSQSSSS